MLSWYECPCCKEEVCDNNSRNKNKKNNNHYHKPDINKGYNNAPEMYHNFNSPQQHGSNGFYYQQNSNNHRNAGTRSVGTSTYEDDVRTRGNPADRMFYKTIGAGWARSYDVKGEFFSFDISKLNYDSLTQFAFKESEKEIMRAMRENSLPLLAVETDIRHGGVSFTKLLPSIGFIYSSGQHSDIFYLCHSALNSSAVKGLQRKVDNYLRSKSVYYYMNDSQRLLFEVLILEKQNISSRNVPRISKRYRFIVRLGDKQSFERAMQRINQIAHLDNNTPFAFKVSVLLCSYKYFMETSDPFTEGRIKDSHNGEGFIFIS